MWKILSCLWSRCWSFSSDVMLNICQDVCRDIYAGLCAQRSRTASPWLLTCCCLQPDT